VPARNLNFTGRTELLTALRELLRARREGAVVQASAMYGLGGVGKPEAPVLAIPARLKMVWQLPT
jgi:hypothetical protein